MSSCFDEKNRHIYIHRILHHPFATNRYHLLQMSQSIIKTRNGHQIVVLPLIHLAVSASSCNEVYPPVLIRRGRRRPRFSSGFAVPGPSSLTSNSAGGDIDLRRERSLRQIYNQRIVHKVNHSRVIRSSCCMILKRVQLHITFGSFSSFHLSHMISL